jgi:hypothetical protein
MVTVNVDRSAALVIRVWDEGGASGFRARLSSVHTSPGQDDGEETLVLASSPGDVVTAVRTWLDRVMPTDPEDSADQE